MNFEEKFAYGYYVWSVISWREIILNGKEVIFYRIENMRLRILRDLFGEKFQKEHEEYKLQMFDAFEKLGRLPDPPRDWRSYSIPAPVWTGIQVVNEGLRICIVAGGVIKWGEEK